MAASDLYPLSSQKGDAIPLEIVKPLSLISFSFATNVAADVTIPAAYNCCWLYATEDCILRFSATNLPAGLVSGTEYDKALFIPKGTPLVVQVTPGECSLLGGAAAGKLYVNHVQQWAGLTQSNQSSFG